MTIDRKIAIAGTARSGKTVFLTSLLNHLEQHKKSEFRVGKNKDVQISNFKKLKVPKKYGAMFDFTGFRDALVYDSKWPKKTRDTSHFICNFKRDDWKAHRSELHFFDMPGERVADAAIAKHSSFDDWSDHILENIRSSTPYRGLAAEFLDLMGGENLSGDHVVACYKTALARFFANFKPLITPSTFLLDQDGSIPSSRTLEELLREKDKRNCGLGAGKGRESAAEFAPLDEDTREKNPKLVKEFARNYKLYHDKVVVPVFKHLNSCKRLIVLVDIPSLLNGGVGMFNDNLHILEDLFDVLSPESWLIRMCTSRVKLDRVAVVATKSDIVSKRDARDGRMISLLKEMARKFDLNLPDTEFKWFTCSAIVSARPTSNTHELRGVLAHNNPEHEERAFEVPEVPRQWPKDWKVGDFRFASVMPRVPANKSIPPEQENLDDIFTFISED